MGDVNFTIGGTPAPFISAMERVKTAAKESAAKVTESFGIEGLKGERAIRGRFIEAFGDITKGGKSTAEAVGGAFESMTEGLKLSMGSMIALLAVSELVKSLYAGFQKANEMKDAVKDALNVSADGTAKSIEGQQQQIQQLKKDADSLNMEGMTSLQAGAEAVAQAFEEGKSIAEVAKENAREYADILGSAQVEEAEAATKKLEDETALITLRREGRDKEADALKQQQDQEEAVSKLVDQRTELQKQLSSGRDKDGRILEGDAASKINDEIQAINGQLTALDIPLNIKDPDSEKKEALIKEEIEARREGQLAGMTSEQKLAQAKLDTAAAQDKLNKLDQFSLAGEQATLDLIKAQNKQKELQADLDRQNKEKQKRLDDVNASVAEEKQKQADIARYGSDPEQMAIAEQTEKLIKDQAELARGGKDAVENAQRALEVEKDKTALMQKQADLVAQQKQAQQELAAAKVEAMLWHGQASSSARVGLGGNITHGNYGNASQLKAVQDSAKSLGKIDANIAILARAIKVAS